MTPPPQAPAPPARLASFGAKSDDVPPEARAAAWIELTRPVADMQIENEGPERVRWWVEGVMLGPLMLGRNHHADADAVTGRAPERIARDGLDMIRIMHCLENGLWWGVEGGEFGQRAGDIVVTDFTRPEFTFTRRQTSQGLVIPRAALAATEDRLDPLHGLVLRPGGAVHALLSAHLDALWAARKSITAEQANDIAAATVALVSELLIRPGAARWAAGRRNEEITLRVLRHIRENLHDVDLGPDVLCRRFGLSRAALYRLFAPLGGVAHHIRNTRLKRALTMLSAPGPAPALGDVAAKVGFESVDALRSAFYRRFGFHPSESRSHAALPATASEGPDPEAAHQAVLSWVSFLRGA